jgi:hypothetical protein
MDGIPDASEGSHAVLRATKLGSNQSHCHRRRNMMASMTRHTEVVDGMKTKEFRSELARAGFPG